ncbi:MAG: response regulator transcription factor [Actinomycetota bacterium]
MDVLTPRELQVVQLIASGLTGKEVGARLGIGESTVETHVEHIRIKLDARSRPHIVARAIAMGLIPSGRDGDS